jgi:Flp pilus assembly secretin CpaC
MDTNNVRKVREAKMLRKPELARRAGICSLVAVVTLMCFFLAQDKVCAQAETALPDLENVLVYPSMAVTVNKSVVIRLPKKVTRVAVTQPQIAEVVVVAPDQLLINGKAVGSTSLVVWFEEKIKTRKR